jgi:hypothetical protein
MSTKICKKCLIDKDINLYWNNKRNKDNKESSCIDCCKKVIEERKEQIKISQQKWREKNKDYAKEYGKSEKSKEYHREYYKQNSDIYIKQKQEWRKENPIKEIKARQKYNRENKDKLNKYHREWKNQRRINDIKYVLKENISRRIRYELNTLLKGRKNNHTIEYLGCSIEHIKIYLEGKFEIGMNWNNYGTSWQIDHIIPCSSWDLSNIFQSMCCWNYRNLQPMWSIENKSKGDRFNELKKEVYIEKMKLLLV